MNQMEFTKSMQRLIGVYGDKFYPVERLKLIFKSVEILNEKEFDDVISNLINECQMAPLPAKILEASRQSIDSYFRRRRNLQETTGTNCGFCAGGGMITARDRKLNHEYAFRCPHCDGAKLKRLSPSIPEWIDHYRKEYLPTSEAPLGSTMTKLFDITKAAKLKSLPTESYAED